MRPAFGAFAVAIVNLGGVCAEAQGTREAQSLTQRGDAYAIAALVRQGEAALGPLLDDLEARARAGAVPEIEADLRALSALGCADARTFERLLAVLDRLDVPDAARPGLQTRFLRTIGDLAAHAGDVPAFERWLGNQPPDPFRDLVRRAVAGTDRIPVVAPTEMRRVEIRWQLRHERSLASLLTLVESDDVDTAELAAERLAAFGGEAAAAVPALGRLLQSSPVANVRVKTNVPGLSSLLHASSQARLAAAEVLLAIAPRAKEAILAHTILLQQGDPGQRVRAVASLRDRNEDPKRLVALMTPLVNDRDPLLRREAIISLGATGPAARSALSVLERVARDRDPRVATAAHSAIRQIRER